MNYISVAGVCALLVSGLEIIEAGYGSWMAGLAWEVHDAEFCRDESLLFELGEGTPFFADRNVGGVAGAVEEGLGGDVLGEIMAWECGIRGAVLRLIMAW